MDLEPIGDSVSVEKMKQKLKQKYPNHNFDKPPEIDRRHKAPSLCKINTNNYIDSEGDLYCGQRYKLTDENGRGYTTETCNALIKAADETSQAEYKEAQDNLYYISATDKLESND